MKLKKGDKVIVIAGKDKGKKSKIIKTFRNENKVLLEGVNLKKKHQKVNQENQTGIVEIPAPVDVSNVAILDPKTDKPSKIGYNFDKKGKKIRIFKSSNTEVK